jgi:hypothetical protein
MNLLPLTFDWGFRMGYVIDWRGEASGSCGTQNASI